MCGYRTEGKLMSDHAALERLARDVGLEPEEVRDTLAADRFAADVGEDERTAGGLGINEVRCFVIDRRIGARGAQPPEVLGAFLRRGWEARSPLEGRERRRLRPGRLLRRWPRCA